MLEQLEVGADPGGNGGHLLRARYLQAVWAVVLEARRLEQRVELVDDLGERYCDHGGEDSRPWGEVACGILACASGRGAAW
jgi:hypothetical protein